MKQALQIINMGRSVVIQVLSAVVNLAVCLAAAGVIVFFQDGFGSGDLYALLFWTVPLAIGLAVSGREILRFLRRRVRLVRWLLIAFAAGVIAFGFVWLVYLFMGPWINAFSVPTFYLWTGGAFAQLLVLELALSFPAAGRKPVRIIWGILALPGMMIASVVGMYILSFAWAFVTRPEKEIFLIPMDFRGKIRIVYGEECGVRPLHEDGGRVLVVPQNGVLIIQPEFEAGVVNHDYYFVDAKGSRVRANVFDDRGRPRKRVMLGGSGTLAGVLEEGRTSTESPSAIDFTDLYVREGDSTALTRGYAGWDAGLDSLTWALMEKCREE